MSPHTSARQTAEALGLGYNTILDRYAETRYLAEYKCGAQCEGKTAADLKQNWSDKQQTKTRNKVYFQRRKKLGEAKKPWDIFTNGFEFWDGESPKEVTVRCNKLIQDIQRRFHRPAFESGNGQGAHGDVVLVGHRWFLMAFAMLWVGWRMEFELEEGGVMTLR